MSQGQSGPKKQHPFTRRRIGDFEIIGEVGRGGMGVVYEARQVSLNRKVALKILPLGLGLNQKRILRFRREAQAAAALHHTNIVPVHAIGEEDGVHFYAMEFIEGEPLSDVLDELRAGRMSLLLGAQGASDRPRPTSTESTSGETGASHATRGTKTWCDTVAKLIAQVAEALEYAHVRGIVHRDIKPANLILSTAGRLSVTDFGLARLAEQPGLTMSGALVGTPAYMSPEEVSGGRMKLDHRTDVYSLGAVLYELLTLNKAHPGESREQIMTSILTRDPMRPRRINARVPADLETICLKALEKDPDRRYRTAGEMAHDLRHYLHGEVITARRPGLPYRLAKFVRRRPVGVLGAVAGVLLLVLGGMFWRVSVERGQEGALRTLADARLQVAQGAYNRALEMIEQAMVRIPEERSARLLRAEVLLKMNREQEAARIAEQLVQEDPLDWRPHVVLARAANILPYLSAEEHIQKVRTGAPETGEAYYLRARVAASAAESIQHLNRALELDPGHAEALFSRGFSFIVLPDFPAARSDAEKLVAMRPQWPWGQLLIALSYDGERDYERALEEYDKAVAIDPGFAVAYSARAWTLWRMGRTQDALDNLSRALELRPDDDQALTNNGIFLLQMGEHQRAGEYLERAIESNPYDHRYYLPLLESHLARGDQAGARLVMRRLRQATEAWNRKTALAGAHRTLSSMAMLLGDDELALQDAEHAVEAMPEEPWGWLQRASAASRLGQTTLVWESCRRAAEMTLKGQSHFIRRARGLHGTCNVTAAALADLSRAEEIDPGNPDVYMMRGDLYAEEKRFDEALEQYSRVLEVAPGWGAAHARRAAVHIAREDYQIALTDFDRQQELGAENPSLHLDRAEVLRLLDRPEEAAEEASRALKIAPRSAAAHRARAQALYDSGVLEEARRAVDAALELGQDQAPLYLLRARIAAHSGQGCAEVEADLRKLDESGGGDPPGLSLLHTLDLHYGCPQARDAETALALARGAAGGDTHDRRVHAALGLAALRAGALDEARTALQAALEGAKHPSLEALFALSIAETRLQRVVAGRELYLRAAARMDAGGMASPALVGLRQEAAELCCPAES